MKATSKISGATVSVTNYQGVFVIYGKKSGRAKKDVFVGRASSFEEAKVIVANWFKRMDEKETARKAYRAEVRAMQKAEKAQATKTFSEGDIVVSSWGYDQTNVDYYQIVRRTDSYAWLQEIGSKVVDATSAMSASVMPDPSQKIGDVIRRKINAYRGEEQSINLTSYNSARPWSGKAQYESYYA